MPRRLSNADLLDTLRFVDDYWAEHGTSPSLREIGEAIRGAPTTGFYLVRHCEDRGWIERLKLDRTHQELRVTEHGREAASTLPDGTRPAGLSQAQVDRLLDALPALEAAVDAQSVTGSHALTPTQLNRLAFVADHLEQADRGRLRSEQSRPVPEDRD